MKYKLINIETKEEHLCNKVTIDGFEYYASDEKTFKQKEICIYGNSLFLIKNILHNTNSFRHLNSKMEVNGIFIKDMSFCKFDSFQPLFKIISTTNPNIDIAKVVDEVEKLCKFNVEKIYSKYIPKDLLDDYIVLYKLGYNKSQETNSFSKEDMIEFAEFVSKYPDKNRNYLGQMLHAKSKYDGAERTIDLLQLWKEQQPKIIYYE